MATGMWTSAAGAAAQSQSVDIIANNLANSDTQGFKKDLPTFKEYLSTVEREHGAEDIPRGSIKDKDLYPLDGKDQAYVVVDGTYTDFRQGNLRVTNAPLDVAMDGPAFLEVSTPQGVRYTRQGSLKLAMDGRLVTSDGNPVLASQPGGLAAQPANAQPGQGGLTAQGGAAVARDPAADTARFINLRDRGNRFSINESGEIYAGGELIAKMSLVEFPDRNTLRKTGGNLFENTDPVKSPGTNGSKTRVHQGVLEGSNVNPVEEMTKLIQANRMFEHDMKAMKTYGELLSKEANDLGKL